MAVTITVKSGFDILICIEYTWLQYKWKKKNNTNEK